MLSLLANLLKALNSNAAPAQISLAVCFAAIMGLTPLYAPHNVLLLLLVALIRVNLTSFLLAFAFFSGLAYALDPLFQDRKILPDLFHIQRSLTSATIIRVGCFTSSFHHTPLKASVFKPGRQ